MRGNDMLIVLAVLLMGAAVGFWMIILEPPGSLTTITTLLP